jgi:hypothetical protein
VIDGTVDIQLKEQVTVHCAMRTSHPLPTLPQVLISERRLEATRALEKYPVLKAAEFTGTAHHASGHTDSWAVFPNTAV